MLPTRRARPTACLLALLLAVLPLTSGCLTTLAIAAVSKSGAADEHVGPAQQTAREVAGSARDAAEQVAQAAQDTFESWSEDFGD